MAGYIIIIVLIVICAVIGRLIAKWATKDMSYENPEKKEFKDEGHYFNNYTQGRNK